MPPRKQKISPPVVEDAPVVFFLKTDDTSQDIIPAGETTSYSDILHAVETSHAAERFNTDLLKSLLEKVHVEKYSEHSACFWCCHTFGWTASVLPVSYDAYKHIYSCEGHFCSPECALAYLYAIPHLSDSTRWNRHVMLRDLYNSMYADDKELSPAPPRELLRMFGGPLDIEQYRDYTAGSNDLVMCELPPIRIQFPSMNVQGPLRDVKKYVSLSTDVVEKASQQLRLKRSKPVHVNIPTIDMCMAFKQTA